MKGSLNSPTFLFYFYIFILFRFKYHICFSILWSVWDSQYETHLFICFRCQVLSFLAKQEITELFLCRSTLLVQVALQVSWAELIATTFALFQTCMGTPWQSFMIVLDDHALSDPYICESRLFINLKPLPQTFPGISSKPVSQLYPGKKIPLWCFSLLSYISYSFRFVFVFASIQGAQNVNLSFCRQWSPGVSQAWFRSNGGDGTLIYKSWYFFKICQKINRLFLFFTPFKRAAVPLLVTRSRTIFEILKRKINIWYVSLSFWCYNTFQNNTIVNFNSTTFVLFGSFIPPLGIATLPFIWSKPSGQPRAPELFSPL